MYIEVCVGISRYVPKDMWYIVHHFLDLVSLAGSVVHSANSAPDDGCSSPRTVKAVWLWFAFRLLSWFLRNETQHCMCITFYAQLRTKIKYLHIPTKTCIYNPALHVHHFLCTAEVKIQIPTHTYKNMHIHAYACTYMLIHSHTCRYLHILHVCACMCMYCVYL